MTGSTQTIEVPHLGGSSIGYKFARPYDPTLPTLVMVNSFTTSCELYRPQFADPALAGAANLLSIEPYGHGVTRTGSEQFTYWDTAHANLQVLKALKISSFFLLGTSQGGWLCVQMAVLAPGAVKGVIIVGTSIDYESQESRDLGCWNVGEFATPMIQELTPAVGSDWAPSDAYCDGLLEAGLGTSVSPEERRFWHATIKKNYAGDDGRKRIRMCAINLRDRDGLHGRLDGVRCPLLWMHGTEDMVYSIKNAEFEIKLFVNSPSAKLTIVKGGQHFLSASHPADVNKAAINFIAAWDKKR